MEQHQPDSLTQAIHEGWEHLRRQRPLAAWAAWQSALRYDPDHKAALQALDALARAQPLPALAKATLRFRPPAHARRAVWNHILTGRDLSDLNAASDAFSELAQTDPQDSAAAYNQAVCLAWQGRNLDAIASLDRVVRLAAASAPEDAIEAWKLAELLRQGGGAESEADELSYSLIMPMPTFADADADSAIASASLDWDDWLAEAEASGELRLISDPETQAEAEDQAIQRIYEWMDRPAIEPSSSSLDDLNASRLPRVLAIAIRTPDAWRLSSPTLANLKRIESRLPNRCERSATPLPLNMLDAAAWTFRLPPGLDEETRRWLIRDAVAQYYEETWAHQPRLGLAGRTPTEAGASNDPIDQARLEAVLRFREQIDASSQPAQTLGLRYNFERLRSRIIPGYQDPNPPLSSS